MLANNLKKNLTTAIFELIVKYHQDAKHYLCQYTKGKFFPRANKVMNIISSQLNLQDSRQTDG